MLISALEHYSYCPRQCALIHVEQIFEENIYTVQGHMLHERVDESAEEIRAGRADRARAAVVVKTPRLGWQG